MMIVRKRFIVYLLTIGMLISMMSAVAMADTTVPCAGSEHESWKELSKDGGTLTEGNYVLASDIDLLNNITSEGNVNLCLNGHTLSGNGYDAVISISNGVFTLCDCKGSGAVTGGRKLQNDEQETYGGGVLVGDDATFNMYGGNIIENTAYCGGGVSMLGITGSGKSCFNMYGGKISNNTALHGGGVYVYGCQRLCCFNMYGGEISKNASQSAGGVKVGVYSTFRMYDGVIKNNSAVFSKGGDIVPFGKDAFGYGGGVVNNNEFYMYGGEISGNIAGGSGGGINSSNGSKNYIMGGTVAGNNSNSACGGVSTSSYNNSFSMLAVSGAPYISGNYTCGTFDANRGTYIQGSGLANNLYLDSGIRISIGTPEAPTLTGGNIGITTKDIPTTEIYVNITEKNSEDYSSYFTSDNEEYYVTNRGSGDSQVVQLMGKGGTPAPILEQDYCYSDSPVLTVINHATLTDADYRLYTWDDSTSQYEYSEDATGSMKRSGDTVELGEGLTEKMAITAIRSGMTESAKTDFSVLEREPEDTYYAISFDANGGSGSMAEVKVKAGEEYTLPTCGFAAPEGKMFSCWLIGTEGNKTFPGESIAVTEDITVKPSWVVNPEWGIYVVYFEADGFENDFGAGSMEPQKVPVGDKFVLPFCGFVHPDGRQFKAWQVKGREYDPGDEITVNENLTVWAMWHPDTPETPETGGEDISGNLPLGEGEEGGKKPAEILLFGPDAVIRNDPDIAPKVEITKYEDIEDIEGIIDQFGEIKGFANNNKQNYAYYEIDLENAEIKEDAEIEIKFFFGTDHKNKTVWVLHKCSRHNKVEKHDDLKVDKDGYVKITVHSLSPFIVGFDEIPENPASQSNGTGIKVEYNGGNSFSTSKSDVPTSVEIDGVAVPFTGDGRLFTVNSIPAGAKWVTVRWNSTSVTTNFTPYGAYAAEVEIPKTGDISLWATVLAFFGL